MRPQTRGRDSVLLRRSHVLMRTRLRRRFLAPDGTIDKLPIGSIPTEEHGDCYSLPVALDELPMERKIRWEEDPHPECVKPMNEVQMRQWKSGVYKKDKKTDEYLDPYLAEDGDEYHQKVCRLPLPQTPAISALTHLICSARNGTGFPRSCGRRMRRSR